MFDLFRSRAKLVRIMLGALLLVVALSMVTYLIPGGTLGTQTESSVVAEVGNRTLTQTDLQRAIQAQNQRQQLPPEAAAIYIPQLADALITQFAVAYEAERMGFRVTDADLAAEIKRSLPQLFQGNTYAGDQALATVLAQQNLTIPQFEAALRTQILLNDLQGLAAEGIVVSQQELEAAFHRQNDKVKIEFVPVSGSKLLPQLSITPAEIKEYYDKNRTGFQVPEKRSFQALVVDQDKVAQTITVPDEELRRLYEQNKDSFRVSERVHVRHILLKTTGKSPAEVAKLKAQAEDLDKKLKQGADFAELAKKYSEDTGSAAKGGELGWVVRGQTVKAFEDAAFSLKPKEISNVITTEYGFHIIQVLEKEQAHVRPFEEVKAQLADERKKQAVYDRMEQLAEQARTALRKDPLAAAKVAVDLNLQLVTADKVGAEDYIPGIGVSRELQDALASLNKGEVSGVVQIGPTRLAVAVLTQVFPAHQADLAEAETQIRERLGTEKLTKMVDERASQLLARAKALKDDLAKAAKEMGLELKTPPEFARDGAVEGLGGAMYVDQAFSLPIGQVFVSERLSDQKFVCKVVAKAPADMSQFAAQRDTLLQEVKNTKARERLELLQTGIRDQLVKEGKIKIHQDVINRIISNYRSS